MDELKNYLQEHRDQLDTEVPGELVWDKVRSALGQDPHAMTNEAGPGLRVIQQKVSMPRTSNRRSRWIPYFAIAASLVAAVWIGLSTWQPWLRENNSPHWNTASLLHNGSSVIALAGKMADQSIKNLVDPHPKAQSVESMDTVRVVAYIKKAPKKRQPVKEPDPVLALQATYASVIDEQLKQVRQLPIYGEKAEYFETFRKQFVSLADDEKKIRHMIRQQGLSEEALDALLNNYQQKIRILRSLQFEISSMNNKMRQVNPGQQLNPSYINL